MKKECSLIATVRLNDDLSKILANKHVSAVRFNTGVETYETVNETLNILKSATEFLKKELWIDIKGRQLRVVKWADPMYSCIELNHKIDILYPAQIYFRNSDKVNITHVKNGNKIFIDPLPRQALGAGQSVNIIAKEITIDGYLTDKDKEFLKLCKEQGINNIMASFVEEYSDLIQIKKYLPSANIISKIESLKGIEFILKNRVSGLMAARDDLYLESGQGNKMLKYLKMIISKDKNAICASKIFTSLEKRDRVDFSDFADLELMYNLGYRKFMLCDNVSNYAFEKAIDAWEEFING